MIGELAPVVMLPRFTSYIGPGTYTTVALDVSDFEGVALEFWRGPLVGGGGASFVAYLEEASEPWEDSGGWTNLSTLTTANDSELLDLDFTRKYFRIRVVLTAGENLVAITCWAAGSLQRRIPPGANG